jgi:DNA-binding MarR family transcriptional regulator
LNSIKKLNQKGLRPLYFFMSIEEDIKQPRFRNPFQKAGINLIFTASWLDGKQQEFFKPFGITSRQFNILRILRGQYPNQISGSEIKTRMLDKNSDLPRLMTRLAIKKLITRKPCPNDKRAVDVVITEKGLSLLAKIDKTIQVVDNLLSPLTPDEATQLSYLLDKCRG